MVTKITDGVKVSVETFYQADYSNPLQSDHMFAYRITIENMTARDLKLHGRHLSIFDSGYPHYREVEGEGVVGVQPVIKSGEEYQYVSGANLHSEMGTMHGTYLMVDTRSNETVLVKIPRFELVVPCKLN